MYYQSLKLPYLLWIFFLAGHFTLVAQQTSNVGSVVKSDQTYLHQKISDDSSGVFRIVRTSDNLVLWSSAGQSQIAGKDFLKYSQIIDVSANGDHFYALLSLDLGLLWIESKKNADGNCQTVFERQLLDAATAKDPPKKIFLTESGEIGIIRKNGTGVKLKVTGMNGVKIGE